MTERGRWAWAPALLVIAVTVALVLLDLLDQPVSAWFARRAFTSSVLSGVLVLLITVLLADRVTTLRRLRDRSQATAAQAAILMGQARRAAREVSDALAGSENRDSAVEEVRTYLVMLQMSAPVLIEAGSSRRFLERSQVLGGELTRALVRTRSRQAPSAELGERLQSAVDGLRAAAGPLLDRLDPDQRIAISRDADGPDPPGDPPAAA